MTMRRCHSKTPPCMQNRFDGGQLPAGVLNEASVGQDAVAFHPDRAPQPAGSVCGAPKPVPAICNGKADLAAALGFAHVELGLAPSLQGLAGCLPEV